MELAAAQKREQIRSMIKTKRRHLSCDDWELCSQAICEKIIKLPFYKEADILFAFMSFDNEPDTKHLIKHALTNHKKVAVPKCEAGHRMTFYRILSLDEVSAGQYGISEPVNTDQVRKLQSTDHSLILVPGIAFDLQGNRLGFGHGYYDRFLSGSTLGITVMPAFSFQRTDGIPAAKTDVPIDCIVTENNVFYTADNRYV